LAWITIEAQHADYPSSTWGCRGSDRGRRRRPASRPRRPNGVRETPRAGTRAPVSSS